MISMGRHHRRVKVSLAAGLVAGLFGAACESEPDKVAPAAPEVNFEQTKQEAMAQAEAPLQTEAVADRTSDLAAIAAEATPLGPIERVREFSCDPSAVLDIADISDVAGLEGATMAIRPSREPCQYHLIFREKDREVKLSEEPGGYLLTTAGVAPTGRAMACASNIHHTAEKGAELSATEELPRRIQRVGIECSARLDDGRWTSLQTVLGGNEDYAAWVVEVQQSNRAADKFRLVWIRDFSFQFLNLSNEGRPATDGTYATDFRLERAGDSLTLVPLETQRLGDVIPPEAVAMDPWEPTTRAELELPGIPTPIND